MRTQGGEAIIGRDHPAGVLQAEIARAAESHGGLVLITGRPGSARPPWPAGPPRRGGGGGAGPQRLLLGLRQRARLLAVGAGGARAPAGRRSRGVGGGRGRRRLRPGGAARRGAGRPGRPGVPARPRPGRGVPGLRRGDQRPGRGRPGPPGGGRGRRPALGRPGVAAAAGVRGPAHLVRAAAADRHLPRRRGGAGRASPGPAAAPARGQGDDDHPDRPRPRRGGRPDGQDGGS